MSKQVRTTVVMVCACAMLAGTAGVASAQQTLNLTFGGFAVRGEDARVQGDWLNENRTYLTFDIKDFNGPTVGAEWLVPLGQFVEAGAGVSVSRRTVPSVYTDFVDIDGSEIEQDLRLRIVPVAFTLRVLPFGQSSPVQPYFGAGVGLFSWRYSEAGEFIDFSRGNTTFREQYVASGTETGPIAMGGIRFASDAFSAGGEVRYQSATGELGPVFETDTLPDPKIDLGGWSYLFTVGIRFGR